ncbi:MAG: phage tail protein [Proteobacteria bacterium]|nr:phage tail protein [Pseudomonadota bacterium]
MAIPAVTRNRRRTRTYDIPDDNLEEIIAAIETLLIPTGSIVPTMASEEPNASWKLLNGQALSKAAFADLYAIIGDAYGATEANFNLPNLQGRAMFGAGGDVALGALAGNRLITLSVSQLPAHGHAVTDPGHGHSFNPTPHSHSAAAVVDAAAAEGTDVGAAEAGTTGDTSADGTVEQAVTGISIEETGGGASIDILPPVIGVNWLIKV